MRCPECQHANVAGSLFCEVCGADLDTQVVALPTPAPAIAEPASPAEPAAQTTGLGGGSEAADGSVPTGALVCAHCGHGNDPRFVICEACGRALTRIAVVAADEAPARRLETAAAQPAPAPPAAPSLVSGQLATGPQRGKVKLVVEQGMVLGKQFLLSEEQSLVGREDAADRIFPEIDLSGLDEGYVHRRHALLTFEGTFLFVTHLGGHNRTYVNNRPIADHLPHPVNIGDTVRFGKVLLRVTEA
ncbi:MAG: FHA domain-containing protein [Armatimonadetes bacterium]|nr:FHA domain-containing protein [Armatimonadota bacterium]